jgi:hypothetical protein
LPPRPRPSGLPMSSGGGIVFSHRATAPVKTGRPPSSLASLRVAPDRGDRAKGPLRGPAMSTFDALRGLYWGAMTIVSLSVVISRKPLARWLPPRMRYGRKSPDVQRLYARSMLFGGIGIALFSVLALYVSVVVTPRLDRTLTQITATPRPPPTAFGRSPRARPGCLGRRVRQQSL